MAARVQVIVEAKDAASGVLRGITSQLGSFGALLEDITGKSISWGNVASSAATMAIRGLQESINTTQDYAAEVRNLALVQGEGAEEASRMLQVLDDYEISAQDVTAATRAMTKQGLAPTVETLAQLSDQYLEITDAQERNEFVIKNLGRAGLEWVNVLQQGGDEIMALNSAVNENLILTDDQIRKTEEYRLAQDALQDNIQGVKVEFGLAAMDVLNTNFQMERMIDLAKDLGADSPIEAQRFAATIVSMANEVDSASQSYTAMAAAFTASGAAADDATAAYAGNLDMIKKLSEATQEQIGVAAFGQLQTTLSEGGLTAAEGALLEEAGIKLGIFDEKAAGTAESIAEINAQLQSGAINVSTYIALLNQIPDTIDTTITQSFATASQQSGAAVQNCFIAGTLVEMADGTQKPIENVKIGDGIISHDPQSGVDVFSVVEETFIHDAPGYLLIDGLGVTGEHPVFVNGDWQNASTIAAGDTMRTMQGNHVVQEVRTISEPVKVYNLHADRDPHTYYANGFVVHNKQEGGVVYAGNQYRVGETGPEPFFPAVNGRILGHAESLHALTLGGGGSMYFYGNVELKIGEEQAGGLLTLR